MHGFCSSAARSEAAAAAMGGNKIDFNNFIKDDVKAWAA